MKVAGSGWTPIEIRRAAEIWQRDFADHYDEDDAPLGAQAEVFARIAETIRRPIGTVASRYRNMGPTFSAGPRSGKVASKTIEDRERRLAAKATQDLTASVFGDPPPGYSALDKRRQGLQR